MKVYVSCFGVVKTRNSINLYLQYNYITNLLDSHGKLKGERKVVYCDAYFV